MEKIESREEEEKIRAYVMQFIDCYRAARQKIGIPLDVERLKKLVEEMEVEISHKEGTTGTFQVNQVGKKFSVVKNNFGKNGMERNNFLMLHEMTHLSSLYNRTLNKDGLKKVMEDFNNYSSIKHNDDMSGFDAVKGLIAIEEVLAQWCCEKCDEALTGKKKIIHEEEHNVLGTSIKIKTDFSEHDVYAPLEGYVEDFAKSLNYSNLEEFARDMITGKRNIFEMINEENVETIGYIGILCEGIYQENGFEDFGIPESDIPKALRYLNGRRQDITSPDVPEDSDR